jgi:hypothetical protein
VTARPYLDGAPPSFQRVEQTASTSPAQPPEALEGIASETQTNTATSPRIARNFARQMLVAFALSAASVSPLGTALPLRRRFENLAAVESLPTEVDPILVEHMRQIFERGASEFFEDGMDSNFALELIDSVIVHGSTAIDAIAEYVFSPKANSDVGSEALRRLADVEDRRSLPARWGLLQRSLRHRSSRVRDGAILGFAALDDDRALDFLTKAEVEEQIPELRQLIKKVVEQLRVKHAEAAAQG